MPRILPSSLRMRCDPLNAPRTQASPLADAPALYFTLGHVSGALADPAGGNAAPESCFAGALRPACALLPPLYGVPLHAACLALGARPGAHRGDGACLCGRRRRGGRPRKTETSRRATPRTTCRMRSLRFPSMLSDA
jgi:hypothetical protein